MRILLGGIERLDAEVMSALPEDAVCFHAAAAAELRENAFACSPDVVLADRALADLDSTLQQISAMLPVPVVLLTHQAMTDMEHGGIDPYTTAERVLRKFSAA